MIAPMIKDIEQAKSTAPAATSFVSFAYGWYSGEVRSISISMAVLKASATSGKPIAKTSPNHSYSDILKEKPRIMATTAKEA